MTIPGTQVWRPCHQESSCLQGFHNVNHMQSSKARLVSAV
jgi:hypothetical protein